MQPLEAPLLLKTKIMIKYPVIFLLLSCLFSWPGLYGQESYLLKIQPKAGTEYRFISNVNVSVTNGQETVMSTQMEQSIVSKITASDAQLVATSERVEKIKGSSTSMGRTFDFDTSNPMAGNPTMNAQMEQLVGKDMVSRFKPNGVFVASDNPFEAASGGPSSASDFRTLTGNARFPDYALKIGDSWTVVDTIHNQGMTNILHTTWMLQEIKDDLAILSATGIGSIAGTPPMLPDGKVEGTMSSKGSAKIELHTGISREANLRIEAKMNMSYSGQTQVLTSVTESAARQVN